MPPRLHEYTLRQPDAKAFLKTAKDEVVQDQQSAIAAFCRLYQHRRYRDARSVEEHALAAIRI
jgi:hypothetical protein